MPLCRFASTFLKPLTKTTMSIANFFELLTGVVVPIAIGCDVDHASVYTKKLRWFYCRRLLHFAAGTEIKLPVLQQQISFALFCLQLLLLSLAANERNLLPAIYSPDAH